MSVNENFPAIMRSLALGDSATAKRLITDFSTDQHEQLYIYGTAVMSICLEHRFKDDSSPEAVRSFVNEMRYDFRNAEPPIKPLMIEAYIRAFCGEEHLLDEVPDSERMDAQIPIIRKIVGQSPELQGGIDDVMKDAEQLADSWAREED